MHDLTDNQSREAETRRADDLAGANRDKEEFMAMLSHMGVPAWMGYLTVAAEFGGGILLVVGFLTRLAALAIFIDMLVAIVKVHLHNGLFAKDGGFEFPMVCAAIAFSLIWSGAGPIAMDWLWGSKGGR